MTLEHSLPLCCYADTEDPLEIHLYAAYNRGGPEESRGLNYQGNPCPSWDDLPEAVKAKWQSTAQMALTLVSDPPATGFGFDQAILYLKLGRKVRRAGWNGKSMWVAMTPGSSIPRSAARTGAAQHLSEEIGISRAEAAAKQGYLAADHSYLEGGTIDICPHIDMRAADGSLVVGWLASQTDLLAEDWDLVP